MKTFVKGRRGGRGMNRWLFGALVLPLLALSAGMLEAQDRRGAPRQELERQVRERFEAVVRERLDLTEAQARALRSVVDELHEDRRALQIREFRLQRSLRSLATASDAETERLLEEIVEVRREEVRLFTLEVDRLEQVLSPRQLLEFLRLRQEMGDRIRRLRRGGGPGGGGTSGAGGAFDTWSPPLATR